jgi:hypothetical protein
MMQSLTIPEYLKDFCVAWAAAEREGLAPELGGELFRQTLSCWLLRERPVSDLLECIAWASGAHELVKEMVRRALESPGQAEPPQELGKGRIGHDKVEDHG